MLRFDNKTKGTEFDEAHLLSFGCFVWYLVGKGKKIFKFKILRRPLVNQDQKQFWPLSKSDPNFFSGNAHHCDDIASCVRTLSHKTKMWKCWCFLLLYSLNKNQNSELAGSNGWGREERLSMTKTDESSYPSFMKIKI